MNSEFENSINYGFENTINSELQTFALRNNKTEFNFGKMNLEQNTSGKIWFHPFTNLIEGVRVKLPFISLL